MNAALASVVDAIAEAHRSRRQTVLPSAVGSENEAYAVQDAIADRLWRSQGDAIKAWKAGAANPQATPSASPIAGSRIHASPASLAARGFHFIAVEAELAYRIGSDMPTRAQPYSAEEAAAAIASMHVAIEVCDSRLSGWKTADALSKLADNQMNAGLVIGDAAADWRAVVPERQRCLLLVDGEAKADSTGSHALGNPLPLMQWIINHCAARCGGLRAGDVVTTGSWNGMVFVEPGAEVVVRFPGIGEAQVRFPKS